MASGCGSMKRKGCGAHPFCAGYYEDVTLREQVEERNRQWRLFHEWEAAQPPVDRDAARLVADVGAMLQWMPAEARVLDPDPDKLGIRKMIEALSRLSSSR